MERVPPSLDGNSRRSFSLCAAARVFGNGFALSGFSWGSTSPVLLLALVEVFLWGGSLGKILWPGARCEDFWREAGVMLNFLEEHPRSSWRRCGALCELSRVSGHWDEAVAFLSLAGISTFLRHADMLVGAALVVGLVMLVAFGALCVTAVWGRPPRRSPRPEEPPERAVEEPAMELHDLGQWLCLDPFQMKLRARSPEWLWSVRANPGQAGRVFPEQPPLH